MTRHRGEDRRGRGGRWIEGGCAEAAFNDTFVRRVRFSNRFSQKIRRCWTTLAQSVEGRSLELPSCRNVLHLVQFIQRVGTKQLAWDDDGDGGVAKALLMAPV